MLIGVSFPQGQRCGGHHHRCLCRDLACVDRVRLWVRTYGEIRNGSSPVDLDHATDARNGTVLHTVQARLKTTTPVCPAALSPV
jgi:hypothetical protein